MLSFARQKRFLSHSAVELGLKQMPTAGGISVTSLDRIQFANCFARVQSVVLKALRIADFPEREKHREGGTKLPALPRR